jgi:hypothetical protein
MFNLESLATTAKLFCLYKCHVTSGKGEQRLSENDTAVCVVVFFESLDSPCLSVAV